MSYLVLARKYRPQRFSELVGQEHVARTLSNAITQDRVHHAFLFTGARGVGKTSAARILAKALSCEKGPTVEPCGVCDICQEIAGGRSVDVIEIDAASNTKVEETKNVLEGVRYLPARARRKVYIIDEAHMLSAHSWNALLKTLEEPPPHVVFVFATTEAHKIPVTILSRCQRFDFKLIPTARLGVHLEGVLRAESIDAAPDAVRLVARQAAGSVRDALSLLDQTIAYVGRERLTAEVTAEVLGVADRRLLLALAGAALDRDAGAALRLLAEAVDRGVDLGELGRSFLGLLRDIEVVARVAGGGTEITDLVDATPEEVADLRALAARAPAGLMGVFFDRWARAVDEASRLPTPRLLYEMAAVDLCGAEPMIPLGDVLQRLEDLEGRLRGLPVAKRSDPPPSSGGSSAPRRPAPTKSWASPPSTTKPSVRGSDAETAVGAGAPPPPPPIEGPSTDGPPIPTSPLMAVVAAVVPAVAPSLAVAVASAPLAPSAAAAVVSPTPLAVPASRAVPAAAEPLRSADEAWRRIMATFEQKSMALASLLAHAEVLSLEPGTLSLAFANKFDTERADRARGEIEAVATQALGRPTRLNVLTQAVPGVAVLRSEVGAASEAADADRRTREQEARQHPLIRRAQDVFGAVLKEIKT